MVLPDISNVWQACASYTLIQLYDLYVMPKDSHVLPLPLKLNLSCDQSLFFCSLCSKIVVVADIFKRCR